MTACSPTRKLSKWLILNHKSSSCLLKAGQEPCLCHFTLPSQNVVIKYKYPSVMATHQQILQLVGHFEMLHTQLEHRCQR